jgi:hypothetical protein
VVGWCAPSTSVWRPLPRSVSPTRVVRSTDELLLLLSRCELLLLLQLCGRSCTLGPRPRLHDRQTARAQGVR